MWLSYGGQQRELQGYADADGSMAEDRRAISRYAFIIHGGAVSWSAKRQEIVFLSTTESEYVAATSAAKEALWLRSLITQLFNIKLDATTLFSNNQSAIALMKDHQYHARTKYIDIRFHFIRWIIEEGSLRLVFCPTADMIADALTKALPLPKVKHFAAELRESVGIAEGKCATRCVLATRYSFCHSVDFLPFFVCISGLIVASYLQYIEYYFLYSTLSCSVHN